MINTTYSGMYGGVIAGLIPVMCGDIPWSIGGLMRCIEIKSRPGSLNDATFPAAVGKGSVASTWATTNTVIECLSKMLDCSVEHRHDVLSVCCGTWDLSVFAGLDQHGAPFANILFDPMGGGFGAGADHDGIDTGGLPIIPQGRMPDVEMNEFTMPLLYLWRREEIDSGGAGEFRGGLAGSLAVIPHGTSTPMAHVVSGSGKTVPMNVGIAGGHPGNTQSDITLRDTNVVNMLSDGLMPDELGQIEGLVEVRGCEEEGALNVKDVHYMFWQAGGGHGDPLLRDPVAVSNDVLTYRVSIKAAAESYGVIVDAKGTVDMEATVKFREQMRATRMERANKNAATVIRADFASESTSNSNVVTVSHGVSPRHECRHCHCELRGEDGGYWSALAVCDAPAGSAGLRVEESVRLHVDHDVVFRQYCCPSCWTAFDSRVVPVEHLAEEALS